VLNRSFNDSFLEMGISKRFMLDIDGYLNLSIGLFPKDEILQKSFLKVMTLEHPWYQVVKLKAHVEDDNDWRDIKQKLLSCGYGNTLLNVCGFLAKAETFVKIAVRLRYIYNTSVFHRYVYSFKALIKGAEKR